MRLYPRSRLRNMLSGGVNPYNRDLYATNGFSLPITNTNASTKWVEDLDGTLVQSPANYPAMPGMRLTDGVWLPTASDGTLISPISRMLRTAQGSVAEYDETYPGVLVEPAATNYLLNTATPATQTTGSLAAGTYTLWIEGAGSAAVTAGTATISGNGTASAGSPNTFTVSVAGTVTVTVTDPVTFFQLEGGTFPTSKIPTTTAAVTRAADKVSFATPSWLLAHPNDFAFIGTIIPLAAGQYTGFLSWFVDTNNFYSVVLSVSGLTIWHKVLSVTTAVNNSSHAHTAGDRIQYITYQSAILGMGISFRVYASGSWGAWKSWATLETAPAKLPIQITGGLGIGRRGTISYIAATFPMTRILRIPTNLSAAALQAWLIEKAGE